MNANVTIAGIALVILGLFIPLFGWFLLLPLGLIVIFIGLITKEEARTVSVESAPPPPPLEEVLQDADLVTAEMEAIARKITELGTLKEDRESIDQYLAFLKDADLKINTAGKVESSLIQILKDLESQISATESKIADLEKSRDVYGVQRESLELKMSQEKTKLERLKADFERYRSILDGLKSKRDLLANLLNKELGSETIETIGLYLKIMMKYREKYGEGAEKKFKQKLSALTRTGMSRKDALEKLYCEIKS